MKKFIIRPETTVGFPVHVEARRLSDVPDAFARLVGLLVVRRTDDADANGRSFVKFMIGTGAQFVTYELDAESLAEFATA